MYAILFSPANVLSKSGGLWALICFLQPYISNELSGSVILEEIIRNPVIKSPVIGQLCLQETVAVAAWYIWWQRREAVKGEFISTPARSAFSIQALTLNYDRAETKVVPKEVSWCKPPRN